MEINNHVSPQKKSSILSSLAIAGFIATVLLLAWMSIQLVQVFPTAFSSLASLAEGVNQASETMVDDIDLEPILITSNTSITNTGEPITVNWDQKNKRGSYVFTYDCIDGVAITQIQGTIERQLSCDTNYNVGDVDELTLAIEAEQNRFTDVTYQVGFLATGDVTPRAMGLDIVTIVNADIGSTPSSDVVVESDDTATAVNPTPPATETTPTVPATPTFVQEFVYAIPTSDPNGFTDLAASYIAMGDVISNRFVPGTASRSEGGAIQFAIHNFGTKTSGDWTFSVTMPNGSTYESPEQIPLKPNERAVLTVGFQAGGDTQHTFRVVVAESTDRNSANDSFSQRVTLGR